MTGNDLKRMQDGFLEAAKKILLSGDRLRPVGFVVTLHKHVEKLFESGWGVEFLDPKSALVPRDRDDQVATLVIDLAMDWKKLYHAVLNVFPQTRSVLPQMIKLGQEADVDDAYMRVMRAFLTATEKDEKDVIAATMRQICDKVDAFASIFHAEAWMRQSESSESADDVLKSAANGLGLDKKSVEVVMSTMQTYDFTRMIMTPIHREPSDKRNKRDDGKVLGFGDPIEHQASSEDENVLTGRLVGFLKPLPVAS